MAKSKISAPVGFFNAKRKPQNQNQLVFSVQENKTYTRYIADDGETIYSIKIQKDGVILKHIVGADGIVRSPKTDSEKAVFCKLVDYMKTVKQQPSDNKRRMYNEHFKAWYSSDDGGLSWAQETPAICQSLGFSLELIPTGKFVTVEFFNKRGEVSRYNGRTGVKKYLRLANFSHADQGDYFILWVRSAGIKFDSVAMVHKRRIVKLSAGGVVLWQNKSSHYAKTV